MPTQRHALWSGSVGFGLVAVPVAALAAVHPSRASFNLIHEPDRSRVDRRMFCPAEEVFVHPEHMQRGYEYEPGEFIVVRDDEIAGLAPKRSKAIEIQEFVALDAIDSAFYARPYYLVPTGPEKPYQLLVETLASKRVAGLSEFVMHAREHFCALLSLEGVLVLMTLRYPDELRSTVGLAPSAKADKQQVRAMRSAIDELSRDFDIGELEDGYQQRVEQLIKRKRRRKQVVAVYERDEDEDEAATGGDALEQVDLVAALEASLAREREGGE
ncbi:MAG: Ku protein [Planctomycetota bacterium]